MMLLNKIALSSFLYFLKKSVFKKGHAKVTNKRPHKPEPVCSICLYHPAEIHL